MAGLGLRGRSEERLVERLGLAHAGSDGDAADLPAALVVEPARPRDVTAYDALGVDALGAPHQHGPTAQLVTIGCYQRTHRVDVRRDEVVGDDSCEMAEPE